MSSPDFFATRVRTPFSRLMPTRVALPLPSSSMTFEMWIGPGWWVTPSLPCWVSRMLRARRWRVVMFTPSTNSRFFFGSTVSTRPVLPLSLPEMTFTSSPLRILSPAMSEHLRSQRDDLHEVAVAQLARDGAEHARAARVVRGVDDHGGVLVERDVGAVVAAELLLRAHDDRRHDLALLHVPVRDRLLDR